MLNVVQVFSTTQAKPLCVYDPSQIDLWQEHFQIITLTEIMRQKDDVAFAEMLTGFALKKSQMNNVRSRQSFAVTSHH